MEVFSEEVVIIYNSNIISDIIMTVTKKQTSIAIFAAVFVTAMIVGTLVSATSDNMAFARHNQIIDQSNSNSQSSKCKSPDGFASGHGFLGGFAKDGTGGAPLVLCNNFKTNVDAQQGSNIVNP